MLFMLSDGKRKNKNKCQTQKKLSTNCTYMWLLNVFLGNGGWIISTFFPLIA